MIRTSTDRKHNRNNTTNTIELKRYDARWQYAQGRKERPDKVSRYKLNISHAIWRKEKPQVKHVGEDNEDRDGTFGRDCRHEGSDWDEAGVTTEKSEVNLEVSSTAWLLLFGSLWNSERFYNRVDSEIFREIIIVLYSLLFTITSMSK